MARFRILSGAHAQRDGPKDDMGRRKVTTYNAGSPGHDIFESDSDQTKQNKAGPRRIVEVDKDGLLVKLTPA